MTTWTSHTSRELANARQYNEADDRNGRPLVLEVAIAYGVSDLIRLTVDNQQVFLSPGTAKALAKELLDADEHIHQSVGEPDG